MDEKRAPGRLPWKECFKSAIRQMAFMLPVLSAVILLVGLMEAWLTPEDWSVFFGKGDMEDAFWGSGLGSLMTGHPLSSYLIGAGLLNQGVSLAGVSAFLAAWVNVGLVQLPAEAKALGKTFALTRNLSSWALSMIMGLALSFICKAMAPGGL